MKGLTTAIVDLVANTPQDKIMQLATAVAELSDHTDIQFLSSWPQNAAAKGRVDRLVSTWRQTAVSASQLSGMLIGASTGYNAARAEQAVELVWTGPPSRLVATRKTEQALLEVIASARSRVFMTSFVVYEVASVMDALVRAAKNGIEVAFLLEASVTGGVGTTPNAVASIKSRLPGVAIYSWANKTEAYIGGKVHAKVAVSDENLCFVSSANLTGHAMEKNMEAGVLIRGGHAPRALHRHLQALLTTGVVERV